ncbi:MAG: antitoxin [Tetrasphaera sp.]
MSNLNDNLKKTIDDLDLDRRVQELTQLAHKTVADLKAQAGNLAHDNREKVDAWVAKAGAAVDQRTDGKYHDKVEKFGIAVGNAVDKVAEKRAAGSTSDADVTDGWTPPAPPTGDAQPFPSHPYGESAASGGPQDAPTGWPHAEGSAAPEGSPQREADGQTKPWYAAE